MIDVIRNTTISYLGANINFKLIDRLLTKLLHLPISFFEIKNVGDIHERIEDQARIERFITSDSIYTFFSMIVLILLLAVLYLYGPVLFYGFLIISILSFAWIYLFMKKRKTLDYTLFSLHATHKNNLVELISGAQEIKINNLENHFHNKWIKNFKKLYFNEYKLMVNDLIQKSGYEFLSIFKNLFIALLSALFVLKNKFTIGEFFAVSFIVGELNSYLNYLVSFILSFQKAKISFNRLVDILETPNETIGNLSLSNDIQDIYIKNLTFKYDKNLRKKILDNVNITIPQKKITAIVGESGSGKSTLFKILLHYYQDNEGEIYVGNKPFKKLNIKHWRNKCGSVIQNGHLFSDTIRKNIIGNQPFDSKKFNTIINLVNLYDFIEQLPKGIDTVIGDAGISVSGGEKQRILIARALYKDPQYLFFDEATSSLDAFNEKLIFDNIKKFFRSRTILIIAHRLSTFIDADQIIVLKNGKIVEKGNHETLLNLKGEYYRLVKNQI